METIQRSTEADSGSRVAPSVVSIQSCLMLTELVESPLNIYYFAVNKHQVYSYFTAWFIKACPLLKSDLSSFDFDFVENCLFMKLCKTSNIINNHKRKWSKCVVNGKHHHATTCRCHHVRKCQHCSSSSSSSNEWPYAYTTQFTLVVL